MSRLSVGRAWMRGLHLGLSVVTVAGLAACAGNPLVRWDAPVPGSGGENLEHAKAYARSARDAYERRLYDQVGEQTGLSQALIGVGVLATGAGLARAHRDAYTTLALAGGAGYLYGQQKVRPDRARVYLAAIEALDCALAVVIPLDVSERDALALVTALDQVQSALSKQQKELARYRIGPAPDASLVAQSQGLTTAAEAAQAGGRAVLGKARRTGRELVAAVDRVRTETNKAVLETVPDLSSVRLAIAGLADYASMFAPGSDVGERIKSAFAQTQDSGGKGRSPGADSTEQVAALPFDPLVAANAELARAASALLDTLAGFDAQASPSAMQACKVVGVVAPLAVSKAELVFATGSDQTSSVLVSGGVKPYAATSMKAVAGVTVRSPGFDSRLDVTVSKDAAAGEVDLVVQDSSSPPKTQGVKLKLTSGSSDSGARGPVAPSGATTTRKVDLIARIPLAATVPAVAGHVMRVIQRGSDALTLSCSPAAGKAPLPEGSAALLESTGLQAAYAAAGGPPIALNEPTSKCMSRPMPNTAPNTAPKPVPNAERRPQSSPR